MAYCLQSITLRTANSEEGMRKIGAVWQDIQSGKLPVLFDSEHQFQEGISPVSKYHNYETDESGAYDLSILGVRADFFAQMEEGVRAGRYQKYMETGNDMGECAQKAWGRVWHDQKSGMIARTFSEDYESTVPAEYTKDGLAHCYLYTAGSSVH